MSNAFYVNWKAIFVGSMVARGVKGSDLLLFGELKCFEDVINVVLLTPFDKISKHQLDICKYKLSCPTEAQKVMVIVHVLGIKVLSFNPVSNLV